MKVLVVVGLSEHHLQVAFDSLNHGLASTGSAERMLWDALVLS